MIYMFSIRTNSFLESSRCRTRPIETSGCRPRLTPQWYKSKMYFIFELVVQIKQRGEYGVETTGLKPRIEEACLAVCIIPLCTSMYDTACLAVCIIPLCREREFRV